jgi:BirA family biotin operon repressor/biotin-[acetyl-CoA-carboxylase] ligase
VTSLYCEDRHYGYQVLFYNEVNSTNDIARELIEKGSVVEQIVVAQSQRAGRGRAGRTWYSPSNENIYLTHIVDITDMSHEASSITLVAGLAVRKTIAHFSSARVEVKWPNDVWVNDKKIAGILTESILDDTHYAIIGIGIDVNMKELDSSIEEIATSLALLEGKTFDLSDVLEKYGNNAREYFERFKEEGFSVFHDEYIHAMALRERRVSVSFQSEVVEGMVTGITNTGALILNTSRGEVSILAGDVTLLR